MISKSKAVRGFISGLSHQVPETALPLLLKKEDALVFFLNSSIEGLPMGSPIRKSVDEDLYKYVGFLKSDIEKRLVECKQANNTIAAEDDDSVILPVVNKDIFKMIMIRAKSENNFETINNLKCTDHASSENFLQGNVNMEAIINGCQTALVCGQTIESKFFVRRFAKAFQEGEEDIDEKMKQLFTFLNILQAGVSGFSFESLDIISAGDLGALFGCLALFSMSSPDKYTKIRKRIQVNDHDSDEEINSIPNPTKRRKMSGTGLKKKQMESKQDLNILLSLFFVALSGAKEHRFITGNFILNFIETILLDSKESSRVINQIKELSDATTYKTVALDASAALTNSMELANIIDRRDLPGFALISDGKKRCNLIKKWASKIVFSVAKAKFEPSNLTETDEKTYGAFLVDRNPKFQGVQENDISESEGDETNEITSKKNVDAIESENTGEVGGNENTLCSSKQKKVPTLPAVPENEEAINEENDVMSRTPTNKSPTRSSRSRSRINSTSSTDTPSRMTRSRARGLSTSSLDTGDDEASVAVPSRRKTSTRTTSNSSDGEATPSQRSSRRTKFSEESDSEMSTATPRRSSRKKKKINTPS